MMCLPDIEKHPVLEWAGFNWLRGQCIPIEVLIALTPIRTIRGTMADDGIFEEGVEGETFIAFPEAEDVVFWRPGSDHLATWNGRAFALGEDTAFNAGTYSFGGKLNLYRSPLDWMRNRCDGCVIIDWNRAWSRLQDVPRIAVDETLILQYRRHMQPPKGPDAFVVTDWRAAA